MESFQPFQSANSKQARAALYGHYHDNINVYKTVGSHASMWKAVLLGWARSNHPAQLHFGWDCEKLPIDESIRVATRKAIEYLHVNNLSAPLLLEASCGIGGGTAQVVQEFPNIQVIGFSFVPKQLAIANRLKQVRRITDAYFHAANFLDLPYRDRCFDGIFSIESLSHVPGEEKSQVLSELYRVLKPGHRLVIFDGYAPTPSLQGKMGKAYETLKKGYCLPNLIAPQQMRCIGERAGFECIETLDATDRIVGFTRLMYQRALIYTPFVFMGALFTNIPLLKAVSFYLGFSGRQTLYARKAVFAARDLAASRSLTYHIHVFKK